MSSMLEHVSVMDKKQSNPPAKTPRRSDPAALDSPPSETRAFSMGTESFYQRKKREFLRLAPSAVEQEESERLAYVPKGPSR